MRPIKYVVFTNHGGSVYPVDWYELSRDEALASYAAEPDMQLEFEILDKVATELESVLEIELFLFAKVCKYVLSSHRTSDGESYVQLEIGDELVISVVGDELFVELNRIPDAAPGHSMNELDIIHLADPDWFRRLVDETQPRIMPLIGRVREVGSQITCDGTTSKAGQMTL